MQTIGVWVKEDCKGPWKMLNPFLGCKKKNLGLPQKSATSTTRRMMIDHQFASQMAFYHMFMAFYGIHPSSNMTGDQPASPFDSSFRGPCSLRWMVWDPRTGKVGVGHGVLWVTGRKSIPEIFNLKKRVFSFVFSEMPQALVLTQRVLRVWVPQTKKVQLSWICLWGDCLLSEWEI